MEQLDLVVRNFFLIYNQDFARREVLDFFRRDLRERCGRMTQDKGGFF